MVEVERQKAEIVRQWGQWTAHNIHLGAGVYTLGSDHEADKLRRIVQIVSDLGPRPFDQLRVLDLGCLEGGYAVELARRGAEVVAIEARQANLEKARFAKEALGLEKLELVQADVRSLSEAHFGRFDVVLCLGILYHLDAQQVFSFVHQIAEVCRSLAVIDTYVGVNQIRRFEHNGREYWGRVIREHTDQSTVAERLDSRWASLDNPISLWITRSSLYNLLNDAGFSSAYECHLPTELSKPADRLTIVAVKGRAEALLAMPQANEQPMGRLPENDRRATSRKQQFWPDVQERTTNLVPLSWRRSIKAGLRRWREPV